MARRLSELGVEVLTGARATGPAARGKGLRVETAAGAAITVPAETVLVTVGRRPLTEGWGREELALDMAGPFVRIDDQCRTAMRGIFAIGDVTGEPMLAHRAMAQGEMVAEIAAGHPRSWDKCAIPAICYTDPEIVSVGLSPAEAQAGGRDVKVGTFPLSANGRAMTLGATAGFVRTVARADSHLLLGLQAVGQGVRSLPQPSLWRWRWAPGWKTWPARSTPTRPRAKPFRKRPCVPLAAPSTSDPRGAGSGYFCRGASPDSRWSGPGRRRLRPAARPSRMRCHSGQVRPSDCPP